MTAIADITEMDVESEEQLLKLQTKALKEPIRLKLHSALGVPRTITEIAKKLDINRTSLYYHLKILMEVGLVEEHDSRQVRGITEKIYKARDLIIYHHKVEEDENRDETIRKVIRGEVCDLFDDVTRSLDTPGPLNAGVRRVKFSLTRKTLQTKLVMFVELMQEMEERVKELSDEDGEWEFEAAWILHDPVRPDFGK